MSYIDRWKAKPAENATEIAARVAALMQEISDEAPQLRDAQIRRDALLLRGSDQELSALDKETAGIRLRADRARAAMPIVQAQLVAARGEERKARRAALLSELGAVAPGYLRAAFAVAPAAAEYVRVRALLAAEFPAEATAIPQVVPFAIDLGAISGAGGCVVSPPQLLDFDISLQEALAQLKRTAGK